MRKRNTLTILAIFFLVLGLMSTAYAETIKVGAPMPFSGAFSGIGVAYWRGLELAVSDLNAKGGVLGKKLEIIKFDTEELSPERVMQAADQLVLSDKVDSIHAGWAGWGQDVKAYGKYDVPTFHWDGSTSSSQVFLQDPKRNSNVFGMYPTESNGAGKNCEMMTSLAFEYPNKKIAIIVADDDWGIRSAAIWKKIAKERKWDVPIYEVVPYGTREWGSILTKIRSIKPAMIYIEIVSAPDLITFFNQFMENPTNSLINMGYGPETPDFMENIGKEAEGIIGSAVVQITGPNLAIDLTKFNNWIAHFKDKYGVYPTADTIGVYEEVMLWAEAVKKIGSEKKHKAINEYIAKSQYTTMAGWTFTFGEDNTVQLTDKYPAILYQFQNGEKVPLYMDNTDNKYGSNKFIMPPWVKK